MRYKEPSTHFLTWRLIGFVFKSYYPKSMFSKIGSRKAKKEFSSDQTELGTKRLTNK